MVSNVFYQIVTPGLEAGERTKLTAGSQIGANTIPLWPAPDISGDATEADVARYFFQPKE